MRVKRGLAAHRRHKKFLSAAKGGRGGRSRLYRTAREAGERSMQNSFEGRRQRRRDFRQLWISRISAAVAPYGINYSRFIYGLKKSGIEMNRKALSELAIADPEAFKVLVETAKKAL